MNQLEKLFAKRLEEGGAEAKDNYLLIAPDMGGDMKSKSKSVRLAEFLGEYGKYSTNEGRNYYGYAGMTPWNIEKLRLGGALGAYGNSREINPLAGLLATYPIQNGGAKLMISPGKDGPAIFFGMEKKF